MKKPILFGLLFGTAAAAGKLICRAKKHHCRREEHFVSMALFHLDRKLHLTNAQKEKLRTTLTTLAENHRKLKEQKQTLGAHFSELFLSEQFDAASLTTAVQNDCFTPMSASIGQALEDLHAILTPEQRRETVRMIEKRHGCCGHRH